MALRLEQQTDDPSSVADSVQQQLPFMLAAQMDPRTSVLAGFAKLMAAMTAGNAGMARMIPQLQEKLGRMNAVHNNVPTSNEVRMHQAIRDAIQSAGAKSYERFPSGRTIHEVVGEIASVRGPASGVNVPGAMPRAASVPVAAPEQGSRLDQYVNMLKAMFPRLGTYEQSQQVRRMQSAPRDRGKLK